MITPGRVVVAAAVCAAAIAAAGCGGGGGGGGGHGSGSGSTGTTTTAATSSGGKTLQGKVGPGFDISLTQDGQPVSTLAPGTYTLTVDDEADIHDFHLSGPGVDVSTGVSEKGTRTFTITLQAGTYHFQCDPHASSMHGDFTVS